MCAAAANVEQVDITEI